ncbi:hypothetical protein ACFQZC_06380 [Streptacidiphilus monticola]
MLRELGETRHLDFGEYLRWISDYLDHCRRAGKVVFARALSWSEDASWVQWEGEPLRELLYRAREARERDAVHGILEQLLEETVEAAENGGFPVELLRPAYEDGARELRRVLVGAGPGSYRVLAVLCPPEGPVEAWADLTMDADGVLVVEEECLDLLCSLLCTGHALGLPGGLLLAGERTGAGEVRWGWSFDGSRLTPRHASDVALDLTARGAALLAAAAPTRSPRRATR